MEAHLGAGYYRSLAEHDHIDGAVLLVPVTPAEPEGSRKSLLTWKHKRFRNIIIHDNPYQAKTLWFSITFKYVDMILFLPRYVLLV